MAQVIARVHPKSGRLQDVLDVYAEAVPLVHQEQGCELFAVHTDGESVFLVERWTTPDALDAHAKGPVLAKIRSGLDGLVSGPSDIWRVDNIPLGEPAKGTVQ
jgi:quinol monooxygenase YgiN